jgi:hypothetical protein
MAKGNSKFRVIWSKSDLKKQLNGLKWTSPNIKKGIGECEKLK